MKRIAVVMLCLAFLGSYAEAQDTVNGWSFKQTIGDQSAVTRTRIVSDTSAGGMSNSLYVAGEGDFTVSGTKSQSFYFSLPPSTSVQWEKQFGRRYATPPSMYIWVRLNQFGIGRIQDVRSKIYLVDGETVFDAGMLSSSQGDQVGYWIDFGKGVDTTNAPKTFNGLIVEFSFNLTENANGYAELFFDDLWLVYISLRPQGWTEIDSIIVADRFGDPEPAPLAPTFDPSPRALNFGDVPVGERKTDAIWVRNRGTAALEISSVTSNNPTFTASLSKRTIQPRDSVRVSVTFQPRTQGSVNGDIVIVHNALTSPDTVAVSGTGLSTDAVVEESGWLSMKFELRQNYPNPFNPRTCIVYRIPCITHVTLKVYDVQGKEVAILVDDTRGPGTHYTEWSAEQYLTGTYWYRLNAGAFTETKKMLLVR